MSLLRNKRNLIILISAVAVMLMAGGVAVAVAWSGQPQATSTPTSTPSPTPTETVEADADLARSVLFRGAVDSWQFPASAELAAVMSETGAAHSGDVSLAVEAPAARVPTDAAFIEVAVTPGATYNAEAWVRAQARQAGPTAVELQFGDVILPVEEVNAQWQLVGTEVIVPEGVNSITITLRVTGEVANLSLDDVSLSEDDGENIVPNPSFENVKAAAQIANDSLVMSTAIATIAAALPEGDASWQITDIAGKQVHAGTVSGGGAITPIALAGVDQGYYTFTVTDSSESVVSTPIALVDTPGHAVQADARFGVTAQFDRPWHAGAGRLAAALGYGEIHADVLWSRNEKSKGEYAWDESYLTEFAKVRANGLSTIGVIAYGNTLYDGGQFPSSPEALDAFGRYAASAAQTFSLSAVEVFNEPNKDRFNKGPCGTSASCYIPLLDSVRNHFTAQGLTLPIIGGATALYDQAWFTEFWQSGGMDHLDVVSFHPYEGWIDRNPDLMRPTIAQSIADMQQYAGGTRPIWITEMGFTTMTGGVTLEQQRDWLIRSETLALAAGAEKYMWYDIVDDAADPANGEGNFGLYEHEPRPGVAVVSPKSSAFAQALVIAQLGGRAFAADESDDATNVVAFGEADDTVRIAWAVGEKADRVFASTEPVTVVGTSGATTTVKPVDGKITLTLTGTPVFISGFEG